MMAEKHEDFRTSERKEVISLKYPLRENEKIRLAKDVLSGLKANIAIFPSPPVTTAVLEAELKEYEIRRDTAKNDSVKAMQSIALKAETLNSISEKLRSVLRYCENVTKNDNDKLKLLGWGARRAGKSLTKPGQTLSLRSIERGEGWISLTWKAPSNGGTIAAYTVKRRNSSDNIWEVVGSVVDRNIKLENQPVGIELEYCVLAINKAGQGEPGNTITVKL